MDPDFELKIRNSFKKVREDIEFIKKEIEKLKEALNLQNKANLTSKGDVEYPNQSFNDIKRPIQDISIGNDRVSDDKRQADDKRRQAMTSNDNTKPLRSLIENKFRSLTEREFSVFMAIYQLEEEIRTVTYQDIANKLNISGSNLRGHVSSLINKGIPVGKERLFNGKAIFFIKKEFRDLNIVADLIEIRQHKTFKH